MESIESTVTHLCLFQILNTMDESELLNLPEDEFDAFNDETFGDVGGEQDFAYFKLWSS